jgi:hypothetical protein
MSKEQPVVVPTGGDLTGKDAGDEGMSGGRRVKKATVKQLKKMLKKAGLKTTGKRAALTRRAHKAHLKMKGGKVMEGGSSNLTPLPTDTPQKAGRRRSRSRGKILGVKIF